jgi:hypothetical protein
MSRVPERAAESSFMTLEGNTAHEVVVATDAATRFP